MAKATALQLLNKVLSNLNENTVTALTSLSGIQVTAFDALNEALRDIYTMYDFKFSETSATVTMLSATSTYAVASDMLKEDIYSFRSEDEETNLVYIEPQEFDNEYPKVTDTAYPSKFTRYAGRFLFNAIQGATQHNKLIYYRYWKIPTILATGTATGTTDIPEEFEDIVLVNLATYKVLSLEGDTEALAYRIKVFGDGRNDEGSLARMKKFCGSPRLKIRVTNIF